MYCFLILCISPLARVIFPFIHQKGFDEFMNLVLDSAEEVNIKTGTRKTLGRILLKGDNITLIQNVKAADDA